jgi:hypothetical protein
MTGWLPAPAPLSVWLPADPASELTPELGAEPLPVPELGVDPDAAPDDPPAVAPEAVTPDPEPELVPEDEPEPCPWSVPLPLPDESPLALPDDEIFITGVVLAPQATTVATASESHGVRASRRNRMMCFLSWIVDAAQALVRGAPLPRDLNGCQVGRAFASKSQRH